MSGQWSPTPFALDARRRKLASSPTTVICLPRLPPATALKKRGQLHGAGARTKLRCDARCYVVDNSWQRDWPKVNNETAATQQRSRTRIHSTPPTASGSARQTHAPHCRGAQVFTETLFAALARSPLTAEVQRAAVVIIPIAHKRHRRRDSAPRDAGRVAACSGGGNAAQGVGKSHSSARAAASVKALTGAVHDL